MQLSLGKLEKEGQKVGIAGFVCGGEVDATQEEEPGQKREK